MLNNFIYAETKNLFLEHLDSGNILDEAIVFIADTKEIWNHGTYFAGDCGFDQNTIDLIQAAISDIELNKLDKVTAEGLYATKTELPNLELYITKEEADIKYASASDVEEVQSQLENNFATKEFVETEIEKSKSKISSIPITEDLFIFEKEEGTERTMMMEGHVQESRLQEVLSADALEFEGCILSKKNEPLFSSYTVFSGTFLFGVMDEAYVTVMISEDGQFTLTMYLLKKDGDFSASSWDEVEIDNDRKDIFRQNFGFLYELGSHMFEEQSLPLYNDDSRTLTEEYRAIVYNCLGLKIEDNEFIRIAKYDNYSVFQLIWASGISESDSTTMVIETLLVYKDGGVTRQRRTVVNDNRIANAISNSVTFTDSEKQSFKENLGITNNEGGSKVFVFTYDMVKSENEDGSLTIDPANAIEMINSDFINMMDEYNMEKTHTYDDFAAFSLTLKLSPLMSQVIVMYVYSEGVIKIMSAGEEHPFVYDSNSEENENKVRKRLSLLDLALGDSDRKDYTEYIDEVKENVKKNLGITDAVTPNWNASEGEAGYIENRTHYVILDNYITSYAGESNEIREEKFPKWIYYKGVVYDVPLNRMPNSADNTSELILGDNEICLTFDLSNEYGEWLGFAVNHTSNNERIYYGFEVKHLPDVYISDSFVKRTDINNMVATNDDIDALFDINDYYNDYYSLTSETYSLRDKKSILYYTSDKMNTNFVVEQEYFENNKCLSHVYDENLSVGVITFSGEIPSKEEIQKQYIIEIDYIEYE